MRVWNVYLSGEIHTDWREQIIEQTKALELPVEFSAPVTDHDASDDCGAVILGDESEKFWYDNKGAKLNAIRTRTLIEEADIVVVRFGDKYKQWNAAFDAGYASALGTASAAISLEAAPISRRFGKREETTAIVMTLAADSLETVPHETCLRVPGVPGQGDEEAAVP